jgi:hypothetical protein
MPDLLENPDEPFSWFGSIHYRDLSPTEPHIDSGPNIELSPAVN